MDEKTVTGREWTGPGMIDFHEQLVIMEKAFEDRLDYDFDADKRRKLKELRALAETLKLRVYDYYN